MGYAGSDTVPNVGYGSGDLDSEEIFGSNKGYASGPERALLSALLFDGIQSYMNYVFASSASHRSRYREAFNWVHKKDTEYIFSFDCVCEALGVDSNFLRYGLLNSCSSQTYEWKKARRNF